MSHEIFLKIFDGPQKPQISYGLAFLIFLVTSFKKLWVSEQKMFKLAIKRFKKTETFLKTSKIHSGIWQILVTLKNKIFFDVFWLCCCGLHHYDGQRTYTFMTNFLEDSLSADSTVSEIDKPHYFHEGIYFPNNGFHGNMKKAISQLL